MTAPKCAGCWVCKKVIKNKERNLLCSLSCGRKVHQNCVKPDEDDGSDGEPPPATWTCNICPRPLSATEIGAKSEASVLGALLEEQLRKSQVMATEIGELRSKLIFAELETARLKELLQKLQNIGPHSLAKPSASQPQVFRLLTSKSEKVLADSLASARKLHPELQLFMQAVTCEECQTIENERGKYKDIIKSKELAYWTRFCILARHAVKQFFGAVYFSHVCDQVFINALRNFDSSKGQDKLLNLIVSSFKVFKQSKFLPNIQDLIDNQKGNNRTKMRKQVEDVFTSKLLQAADELHIGFSSTQEKEDIRCQLQQVVVTNLMLSGSLVKAMGMLLDRKDCLAEWQIPNDWTAIGCRPLEFEEYLKSKWRTYLGSLVLMTPVEKISWWNYKPAAPEQFECYAKQLVRVPNVDWEPIEKLPVLKFLLQDSPVLFSETLEKLHKGEVAELAKVGADIGISQLMFNCYELMVPPVLSATFHKSQMLPKQKLAVSSWFGSRCCLMEEVGPKLGALLQNSDPSLSKKQHLLQVKHSLTGWAAPKELCQADLIQSTTEFIQNTHVNWQFSINFTLRQQWLAVSLATVLKFEIEVIPLKYWPVPEKYSADVVKVLTFTKVTKECVLLGLMAHEDNSLEALQFFETELMPLVVTNVSLMASAEALEQLRDLKDKCTFSYNGFKASKDCHQLDKKIEEFYQKHPWNFLFYNSKMESTKSKTTFSIKEKSKKVLGDWKKISETLEPFISDYDDNFYGFCNKEIYTALKSVDWIKKGKFVRVVLEVLAAMDFVEHNDKERFLNIEVKSQKLDRPLAAMTGGKLKGMELLGKISCFSLVILHTMVKFRLNGKILQNNPESLVGILVSHSLQLYEMELLHRLAAFAGRYCDFDLISPLKGSKSLHGYKGLINSIQNIMGSNTLRFMVPTFPSAVSYKVADISVLETGFLSFKIIQMKQWSELRIQMLNHVRSTNQFKCEAALFSYLVPCYLTALRECRNTEAKGAVFFCKVVVKLFANIKSMLEEDPKPFEPPKDIDASNVLTQLWIIQNKMLQMVNAFVDYGSCQVSECLAKIFVNTNWLLHDPRSKNKQLLSTCLPNIKYLLQHYQSIFSIVKQTIEGTTSLFSIKSSSSELSAEIKAIYKIHQACFTFLIHIQAVYAASTDEDLCDELNEVIDGIMPQELVAHTWRSAFYYRMTSGEHLSGSHDRFMKGAMKIFIGLLDRYNCAAQGNNFMRSHFHPMSSVDVIEEQMNQMAFQSEGLINFKADWEQYEMLDLEVNRHNPNMPSRPTASASSVPSFKGPIYPDNADAKQPIKSKKFLKPSKEVLGLLEQQMKDKERRTCRVCKKIESGHRQTYITCAECLAKDFPRINHYCSKICEKKAWEKFHEEQHILFDLDMYRSSDDED